MVQVLYHKATNGDFNKATIKIKDEKTLHLISSALVEQLKIADDTIESTDNDFIKQMNQNKLDQLLNLINQLNNPTIIKNEKAELMKRLEKIKQC